MDIPDLAGCHNMDPDQGKRLDQKNSFWNTAVGFSVSVLVPAVGASIYQIVGRRSLLESSLADSSGGDDSLRRMPAVEKSDGYPASGGFSGIAGGVGAGGKAGVFHGMV